MKLAILSRSTNIYSTRRLLEAASGRGHDARVLDTLRFSIDLRSKQPDLYYRRRRVEGFDAVLPRIGASITYFGTAVIRQFEQMDVFCANSSHGNPPTRATSCARLQILSRHRDRHPDRRPSCGTRKDVLPAIERVGGAPVIIKLLEGTQGIGVHAGRDRRRSAEAIIEMLQSQ